MAKQIKDEEVCRLIRQRLEHVALIFELRYQFNDPALVQDVGENGWTHPWLYFDALMHYLLLTCFDLLGQPNEWVSFSEWLESSKKGPEREAAIKTIPTNASPIEISRHLNREYQDTYGVKTSFNNFVLKVLSEQERHELYTSVSIIRARKDGDAHTSYPALGEIIEDGKKLAFLFSLRNKFTHSAITMGSPVAGLWRQAYDPIEIDGKLTKGYFEIHQEIKGSERLIYSVRDWPFVLQRLVKAALDRREDA